MLDIIELIKKHKKDYIIKETALDGKKHKKKLYKMLDDIEKKYDETMNSFEIITNNNADHIRKIKNVTNFLYDMFSLYQPELSDKRRFYYVYNLFNVNTTFVDKKIAVLYNNANHIENPGFYLKCPHCREQHTAKLKTTLKIIKENSQYALDMTNITVICDNCGKEIDFKDVYYFDKNDYNNFIPFKEYVYDNGDKIALSILYKNYYVHNNKIFQRSAAKRFVFNAKTGRNYSFPLWLTKTRKRFSKFEIFQSVTPYSIGNRSGITTDSMYKIGKLIEEKNNSNLSFEKYYLDYCKYIKKGNSSKLSLLAAYNTNKYVNYDKLIRFYALKNNSFSEEIRTSANNIKIINNKNLTNLFEKKLKNKYGKDLSKLEIKKIFREKLAYENIIKDMKDLSSIKEIIKDTNNVLKILNCIENCFGLYLSNMAEIFTSNFVKDAIKLYKETVVVNRIIKSLNEKHSYSLIDEYNDNLIGTHELRDLCKMYDKLKMFIPEMIIPKKFNLTQLHDDYSKDYNRIINIPLVFKYSGEVLNLNDDIKNLKFILATNSKELIKIGNAMSICVGSYADMVQYEKCIIVYVMKNNEYIACIEINPHTKTIVQIKGMRNNLVEDEYFDIIAEWANKNKLCNSNYDTKKEKEHLFTTTKENTFKDFELKATLEYTEEEIVKEIKNEKEIIDVQVAL